MSTMEAPFAVRTTSDPAYRAWRAQNAAKAAHSVESLARRLIDRVDELTPAQAAQLRDALPEIEAVPAHHVEYRFAEDQR